MESFSVNPVGPAAVVARSVLFDQFVGSINENVVRQVFQPPTFSVRRTFGMVLVGLLVNHLEFVVSNGSNQGVTIPRLQLLTDFGPTFGRNGNFLSHRECSISKCCFVDFTMPLPVSYSSPMASRPMYSPYSSIPSTVKMLD